MASHSLRYLNIQNKNDQLVVSPSDFSLKTNYEAWLPCYRFNGLHRTGHLKVYPGDRKDK